MPAPAWGSFPSRAAAERFCSSLPSCEAAPSPDSDSFSFHHTSRNESETSEMSRAELTLALAAVAVRSRRAQAEPRPVAPSRSSSQPPSRRVGTAHAGRAGRSRSYRRRQAGSLASCCSSQRGVRAEAEVTPPAAPHARPLRPAPSGAGAPRAQGAQLRARRWELSFHPPSFGPGSAERRRTTARFPAVSNASSQAQARFPKALLPSFWGGGRGLGRVGHQ